MEEENEERQPNDSKSEKFESDSSEPSVYESGHGSEGSIRDEEECEDGDISLATVIERCWEWWKVCWEQKFFRMIIRSSIVFIIGMKLLKELKGLELLPDGNVPVCTGS